MTLTAFMLPHIRVLAQLGRVYVFANTCDSAVFIKRGLDVPVESLLIQRHISPWYDVRALFALYFRLKVLAPDVVHTITPKAGLLGMLAARLARVPLRVHTFTGQVWVTRRGPMRWLLKTADKCIAALATDVLVDSVSQREFLIAEGVVSSNGSSVLGSGSIAGVDTNRFCPNLAVREGVRAEMGSAPDARVCLFLGRLHRDKGVLDLVSAFLKVAGRHPTAELWLVGPDDDGIIGQIQAALDGRCERWRWVDYTSEPERFMQAADLFCLPSYREGFGSSVIEAAACGVPALVSRIYGLTDAVIEGVTGWMHVPGDVQDLATNLDQLLLAPAELQSKGEIARLNVKKRFEESLITSVMFDFYKTRLGMLDERYN
jgi:glycosyltransferase involved in cell wall biosynthesis